MRPKRQYGSSTSISTSDGSISEWHPRCDAPGDAACCRYAAQYVHVVAEYELTVTRDDHALLQKLEADCQQPS